MSKYSSSAHQRPLPPKNQTPPLLRGVGCLTMVAVPIFSWFLGVGLVQLYGNILPAQWMGYPKINPLFYRLSGITPVLDFFANQQALEAKVIVSLVIIIVLGVLLSVVYGYIYNIFGPSRYGPMDVPPPNVRTKKYRR